MFLCSPFHRSTSTQGLVPMVSTRSLRLGFLCLILSPLFAACSSAPVRTTGPEAPPAPALARGVEAHASEASASRQDRRSRRRSDEGIANSTGYTIGVAGQQIRVTGEFDGDEALVGPDDVIVIPDLDSDTGYKASVGYRWRSSAFELSVEAVEHDGDFGGLPADTTFYSINATWREYFWVKSFLQPYGLFGIGVVRGDIDDGSSDGMTTEDATLDGIQVQVGAGLALYVLRHLSFDVYGLYRFVRFMEADGIGGNLPIGENLEGDSWVLGVGATLIF